MIKRVVFLIAFLALIASQSFAQLSIGCNIGLLCNRPFMYQTQYNYYNYSGHWGGGAGLIIDYHFNDRWAIAFEPSIQQKGYVSVATSHYSEVINRDGYLSFPLIAEFAFVKTKIGDFFIDAGAYAAYWCCYYRKYSVCSLTGDFYSFTNNETIDDNVGNRFELGLVGGLGYKYNLSTKWSVCLSIRYQYALTDQFKAPQSILFLNPNDAFIAQTGFLYHLK